MRLPAGSFFSGKYGKKIFENVRKHVKNEKGGKQALNHFVEDLTCGQQAHAAGAPREGKNAPGPGSSSGLCQAERGDVGPLPVGWAILPPGAGVWIITEMVTNAY
jgi:hypothetical protein